MVGQSTEVRKVRVLYGLGTKLLWEELTWAVFPLKSKNLSLSGPPTCADSSLGTEGGSRGSPSWRVAQKGADFRSFLDFSAVAFWVLQR